ncbi:zinc finger protein 664 [Biomphalaria pfeifferi]|uniref:Zinc finger protein 664 n=1 Tax=Biomphalaria pfeifferi TaxID=112525 RepID=A0AAD8FI52_BIOPF|nr:zinc finger protein 664 [Biomphalaria pfeifferi]
MDKTWSTMSYKEEIQTDLMKAGTQDKFNLKNEIKIENQEMDDIDFTVQTSENEHQEDIMGQEKVFNARTPTDEREQRTSEVNAAANDTENALDKTLFSYVTTKHMKNTTNHSKLKKVFKCQICEKEFTLSTSLKRHRSSLVCAYPVSTTLLTLSAPLCLLCQPHSAYCQRHSAYFVSATVSAPLCLLCHLHSAYSVSPTLLTLSTPLCLLCQPHSAYSVSATLLTLSAPLCLLCQRHSAYSVSPTLLTLSAPLFLLCQPHSAYSVRATLLTLSAPLCLLCQPHSVYSVNATLLTLSAPLCLLCQGHSAYSVSATH